MESWAGMAGSHGSSLPAPGTLTADATAPAELVAGPGEHPVDTPARVAGRVVVRIGGTVHREGGSSERQGPDEQGLVEGSGCRDQQCDAAWRGRVRRTVEDLELIRPGRRTEPAAWPYELAVEEPVTRRVAVAFDELALAI
jgi:hypothetical protein